MPSWSGASSTVRAGPTVSTCSPTRIVEPGSIKTPIWERSDREGDAFTQGNNYLTGESVAQHRTISQDNDRFSLGADYAIADIVGREVVESRGGTVTTIALREGLSSSAIIDRIKTGRGV